MTNKVLCFTSVLMFVAHSQFCKGYLGAFYVFGTITSILNHSQTSRTAKVVDRLTMLLGFVMDTFLIFFKIQHTKGVLATLVWGAALCCFSNTITHTLAHALITLAHAGISSST